MDKLFLSDKNKNICTGRYLCFLPESWSCFPSHLQGVPRGSSCRSFGTSPELVPSSTSGFLEDHLLQACDTPTRTFHQYPLNKPLSSNNIQLTGCWHCQRSLEEGGRCSVPGPRPGWMKVAPRAETVMAFDSVWDIQHSRGQLSGRLVGEWREKRKCRSKVHKERERPKRGEGGNVEGKQKRQKPKEGSIIGFQEPVEMIHRFN